MSNTAKRLVGLFLLILGCLWILDTVNLIHIKIFFEGWWTLFIILPCVVALFNDNDKTGPVIGISIGVVLLLCAQGIIDWSSIWKLILAIFAIVWGCTLLFSKKNILDFRNAENVRVDQLKLVSRDGRNIRVSEFNLGHHSVNFAGQRFEGGDFKVNFAGAEIDLRGADIDDGAILNVNVAFGGLEIFVDECVCVRQSVNCALGGIEDHHRVAAMGTMKTLYITGSCSFGGVEIK